METDFGHGLAWLSIWIAAVAMALLSSLPSKVSTWG